MTSGDAIVVGGGIVGVAVARQLAHSGRRTLLLEKGALGGAVSGASLACIGTHMIDCEEIPALIWSCEAWAEWADTLDDMEYSRCGQLRFLVDDEDRPVAQQWIDAESQHGLQPQLLEPTEVRELEPALTGPIAAATWSPDDAVVNPFLAVRSLVTDGLRHGLEVRSGVAVERLIVERDRIAGVVAGGTRYPAPVVVLATGPWTAGLAATAGITLPIRSRKAQCLATVAMPPTIRRVVGACESAGGVTAGYTQIQQAASGQVLFNTVLAGGVSAGGQPDRIPEVDAVFVRDSIRTLLWLFPSLRDVDLLRSWVRYEAVTPDDRFCAGPVADRPGLLIAAGDCGTGFVRAPAMARLIVDSLDGATLPFPAALYDPGRYVT